MIPVRQIARRWVLLLVALPLLAACQAPPLQIRPVGTSFAAAQMGAQRRDADYDKARAAIERRDYAAALEWLQAAREGNPRDVRVLNAFGVVYDKLGRFDLSVRYYQQALAVDQGSEIVAHNLAYSESLRTRIVASPVTWETADIKPPADMVPAVEGRGTALASARHRGGSPLTVVNATGQTQGHQPVFACLARLKWSLGGHRIRQGAPTPASVIRYTTTYRSLATALARTLPRHPRLVEAEDGETGVHLILGADSLGWKLPSGLTG